MLYVSFEEIVIVSLLLLFIGFRFGLTTGSRLGNWGNRGHYD